jgi:hypothetical protein
MDVLHDDGVIGCGARHSNPAGSRRRPPWEAAQVKNSPWVQDLRIGMFMVSPVF